MVGRRLVPEDERHARLARRHRLIPEAQTNDIGVIADDVVALHSSDPATVYLSALARMADPQIVTVDAALYDDRCIIRHHAMRRTMWVMTPATARRAHAAATRTIATSERRRTLAALAASPAIDDAVTWYDNAVAEVTELLAGGAMTTREVGVALPHLVRPIVFGAGTRNPATLNAHTKVLQGAAFEARLIRTRPSGTWTSSEYAWVAVETWLGEPLASDEPGTAAAALLDHWLHRFGPATETDIRWWFGWTAKVTRTALSDVGAQLVDLADGTGWLAIDDLEPVPDVAPWVALLPSLDPTTMGWKERDWYLDTAMIPRQFDRFGNAGPTVWADGAVVGGWIQRPDGEIVFDLPARLRSEHRTLLDAATERLTTALDRTIVKPRFPSPTQAELLA